MVRGEAATSNWTVYTLQNQAPELERKEEKGRQGEKGRKKETKMLNKNFPLTFVSIWMSVCSSTTFLFFYAYKNNFGFGGASYN